MFAMRRYPTAKVRSSGYTLLTFALAPEICSCEEIPHIQGKRNPNKMVGTERRHQRADTETTITEN